MAVPGVVAAGTYAYHGDRLSFSHRGQLDASAASAASVLCRAQTLALRMEMALLEALPDVAGAPAPGWIVRGPRHSVCTVANVFCFVDATPGALNAAMDILRRRLDDPDALIY